MYIHIAQSGKLAKYSTTTSSQCAAATPVLSDIHRGQGHDGQKSPNQRAVHSSQAQEHSNGCTCHGHSSAQHRQWRCDHLEPGWRWLLCKDPQACILYFACQPPVAKHIERRQSHVNNEGVRPDHARRQTALHQKVAVNIACCAHEAALFKAPNNCFGYLQAQHLSVRAQEQRVCAIPNK